jgi:predicted small lipoprotein YifL
MTPNRLRIAASLLAVLAIAAAASGCGRRGGLEPPPSADVLATDEQGNVVKPAKPVDQPFILDGLIQ